jgi:hypothetical protein
VLKKGAVKKNTSTSTGRREVFLSSSLSNGVRGSLFPRYEDSFCGVTSRRLSDANKQDGCKVSTMVLSETRGLSGC